ncbi:MAG: YbaK/EbsC family protein [Streptosporangiaceae bacterium]
MRDVLDIHRMLLEDETHHEIVRLRRVIASSDELPEVLGLPERQCLAVRVYAADKRLVALAVRAGDHPSLPALRAAAGARRVRPAAPHVVNSVTDYAAGLVAPVLLPDRVEPLIDSRIVDEAGAADVVYVPTGDGGTALGIRVVDLAAVSGARPIALTLPAHVPRQRMGQATSRTSIEPCPANGPLPDAAADSGESRRPRPAASSWIAWSGHRKRS